MPSTAATSGRHSMAPTEAGVVQRASPATSSRGRGGSAPPFGHSRAGNTTRRSRADQAQNPFDDIVRAGEHIIAQRKDREYEQKAREHERMMKEAEIKLAKYRMEDYRLHISREGFEMERYQTERLREAQAHAERMMLQQIELERIRLQTAVLGAKANLATVGTILGNPPQPVLPGSIENPRVYEDSQDTDLGN